MLVLQCSACKRAIINEVHYSFLLNCERSEEDESVTILTSHELVTLCSDCIDKISVAKILSFPARFFGNTAHDGFAEIEELLDNNNH